MPRVVEYTTVENRLAAEGYRCNYPMSGSFSLIAEHPLIRGWLSSPDETIIPQLASQTRIVKPAELSALALRAWRGILPGPLWVMPASHWSFEFTFGHGDELRELLSENIVNLKAEDVKDLAGQSNGAAIEFDSSESAAAGRVVSRLLEFLSASDFMLIFPGLRANCMIHHHKQLWWVTDHPEVVGKLDQLFPPV